MSLHSAENENNSCLGFCNMLGQQKPDGAWNPRFCSAHGLCSRLTEVIDKMWVTGQQVKNLFTRGISTFKEDLRNLLDTEDSVTCGTTSIALTLLPCIECDMGPVHQLSRCFLKQWIRKHAL